MPHIDDGTLHALLDGALRAEEPGRAAAIEAHLDACADCRARLERAAALKDDAAGILAALDVGLEDHAAPAPDFGEVLARAAAGTGDDDAADAPPHPDPAAGARSPADTRRLRRQLGWTRGLAWAATIVVALGTGYLVRDLAGPTGDVPPSATPMEAAADQLESADVRQPADIEPDRGQTPGEAAPTEDRAQAERPELVAPLVAPTEETAAAKTEVGAVREPEGAAAAASEPEGAAAPAPEVVTVREAEGRFEPIRTTPGAELAGAGGVDGAVRSRQLLRGDVEVAVHIPIDEAEARLGPILRLPGAEVAGAELVDDAVRTRQLLPGGVEVVVLQRPATQTPDSRMQPLQTVSAAEAAPTLVGLALDSVAATVTEPNTVSVVRDGVVLTLTALLPPDVLRALAAMAADGG